MLVHDIKQSKDGDQVCRTQLQKSRTSYPMKIHWIKKTKIIQRRLIFS
uniref:Uncharacterized protein n=1 Tax=Romanomermis culicivorax TaxID=13658 RepID=A0A915JYH0_ROMCU